jgi:colanic acid biosynthesis glycosyl transferase WcaI
MLSYNFSPELTGIGKYNGELADYLHSIGHSVQVVTGYPYYPQWEVLKGYKNLWFTCESTIAVSVCRCPLYVPKKPSGAKRILQDLSFFISSFCAVTWIMLKGQKHDFFLAVAPSFMNGFIGIWYRLFNPKTKLIYHIQDLQVDAARELGIIKNKHLLWGLTTTENFIFNKSNVISTITPGMKKKIVSKGISASKIISFPNWTETKVVTNDLKNYSSLEELSIPLNKKIVFYSGSIGEKQGLELLFDVAELANKNMPDVLFLFAGDGPYTNKLKELSKIRGLKNVKFIPLQQWNVYRQIIDISTINLVIQRRSASDLVMPSKLLSILGSGALALVTADQNTSLYSFITENDLAVAVVPEDFKEIYLAIERIVECKSPNITLEIDRIRLNALNYAENFLSKSATINQFLIDIQLVGK